MLRRAVVQGQTHRVPDHLRQEEVDTLSFEVDGEGVYHIVPSALRGSRGARGIASIDVEAEVRLIEGVMPTEPARIRVVVTPTTSTWVGLIALPLASLAL